MPHPWTGVLARLDDPLPDGRQLRAADAATPPAAGLLPLAAWVAGDLSVVGTITRAWIDGDLLRAAGTIDTGARFEQRSRLAAGERIPVTVRADVDRATPDGDRVIGWQLHSAVIGPAPWDDVGITLDAND